MRVEKKKRRKKKREERGGPKVNRLLVCVRAGDGGLRLIPLCEMFNQNVVEGKAVLADWKMWMASMGLIWVVLSIRSSVVGWGPNGECGCPVGLPGRGVCFGVWWVVGGTAGSYITHDMRCWGRRGQG